MEVNTKTMVKKCLMCKIGVNAKKLQYYNSKIKRFRFRL